MRCLRSSSSCAAASPPVEAVLSEPSTGQTYPLGPALEFLRCIWRLNHALERSSARMERTLGITAPQRLVLRCVGMYPGISAGNLAETLHLDPGTISATLRRLESAGMLERRKDPRDRRRALLGLTPAGHALDRPAGGTVEDAVRQVLEGSSAAELAATTHLLEALSTALEADHER